MAPDPATPHPAEFAPPAFPVCCPVFDADGERVGVVAGVVEDCLVVAGPDFEDHVPLAAVAGFDGRAVRLGLTLEEVHRGQARALG